MMNLRPRAKPGRNNRASLLCLQMYSNRVPPANQQDCTENVRSVPLPKIILCVWLHQVFLERFSHVINTAYFHAVYIQTACTNEPG